MLAGPWGLFAEIGVGLLPFHAVGAEEEDADEAPEEQDAEVKAEQRALSQPEKLAQPAARELRYEDPESAVAEEAPVEEEVAGAEEGREETRGR